MSLSRTICLCLVLTVAAVHVNGIMDQAKKMATSAQDTMKKAQNAAHDAATKISDTAIDEFMKYPCDHGGEMMEGAIKAIKCQPETEKHCKFINSSPMIYQMMCGMTGDNGKDAARNMIKCWTTEIANAQGCMKGWADQYESLMATVETAVNAGG